MGTMVERFVGNGRGRGQGGRQLSTGEMLPCDLAVVGVGVKAKTELAADAGLEVDVGDSVSMPGSSTADPAIFACGDAGDVLASAL